MVIQVNGAEKTMSAIEWLKRRRWRFDLNYDQTYPFSTKFYFDIKDPSQAFIFKLTWA